MVKRYWIYIMASRTGTLYLGVTNALERRIYEHKHDSIPGFSQRYQCHRLVYLEEYLDVRQAIEREKQLKSWNRSKKEALIRRLNPHWNDLAREGSLD
ncbi:MAG: GIY-YIG nuclease family protein [Patescibacteria group bacterium]